MHRLCLTYKTDRRSKQGTNALPQDIDATKREAQVKASDIQTVASDAAEAAQVRVCVRLTHQLYS